MTVHNRVGTDDMLAVEAAAATRGLGLCVRVGPMCKGLGLCVHTVRCDVDEDDEEPEVGEDGEEGYPNERRACAAS